MATQTPQDHRTLFAEVLGLPEDEVRVLKPSIGGGFGSKSKFYPSELLTAWSSIKLERPVKWQATRTEGIGTDAHGRGYDTRCELAVEQDGTILGLRVNTQADLGAYFSKVAPYIATGGYATMLSGKYVIPEIHCRVTGAFTNTAPVDAYRGAGRPEAVFVVERLTDRTATEIGLDPVELRRRNFIPPEAFPYETAAGSSYDSGEYESTLDHALEIVDYDEFRQ